MPDLSEPQPEMLTIDQVRVLMGVSKATVEGWVKKGDLPVFRLRATVRVRRSDLDRMIDMHTSVNSGCRTNPAQVA